MHAAALVVCGACLPSRDPAWVDVETPPASALLPARLRRLSNAEFENTARALLREPVTLGDQLPPDVRQNGYTQNAAQPLPSAAGTRLSELALEWAKVAVEHQRQALLPCAEGDVACTDSALEALAVRAFRRPLSPGERASVRRLFAGAAQSGGVANGLTWTLSGLLQSPSLWYLSEGTRDGARRGPRVVELQDYELASSLAYTVSGAPPDDALLQLAAAGELRDPEVRAREARRLLGKSETRFHLRRFVLEWLEVDRLADTAKNPELYPTYDAVKGAMIAETSAYADEVLVHEGASVRALLDGGFASVDPVMARYYGLQSYGPRVTLHGRRLGVLQQASFLSAHAHENESSPVKRGDFVLRKVLCAATPRPKELDIEVTMPPPDPEQTTRERFARHAADPNCAFCHQKIDGFGFTFESFDAAGRERVRDGARAVDVRTQFAFEGKTLSFADSAEVSRFLAADPRSAPCFLRNVFRFVSAQSDGRSEERFLDLAAALPKDRRENALEALVAFVASDLFLLRRLPE